TLWSEFGRRPEENGSGTDHCAGGPAFVIGSKSRGQMVGAFPGLSTLHPADNLRATSDFRATYSSHLEQWFRFAAAAVIPDAPRALRMDRSNTPLSGFDFPRARSGTRASQNLERGSGTWKLYCTLPGHEALGMRTLIAVGG